MIDQKQAAQGLMANHTLVEQELLLGLEGCTLRLRSNHKPLIEQLRHYFDHVVVQQADHIDLDMVAVECPATDLGLSFTDWKREPGKSGRKDAYVDLSDGRMVQKVRTGMVFLQSEENRIAAGPCMANDNQVINFINAQYMNWLQHRNWLICHASGLVLGDRGMGIAGFSGGGKSTLMLMLLEDERVHYLTNDRLFIQGSKDGVEGVGIPKLPRINPGTIVSNPRLHGLMTPERRQELLDLPKDVLWELEEKHDVLVGQVYGEGRIDLRAPLTHLLILNWSRDSQEPTLVSQIDMNQRRELLSAVMKSPGPFYQYPNGSFLQDTTPLDPDPYMAVLEGVAIYEVTGQLDIQAATKQAMALLGG
ncbi:HprK-related kinase B [Magnetococcus sp. PR-3]|uniref:HprK-related kinase B n=1 Tax=Magnetococcus sp. PR-3 TaxID=3120355 RepID=UPI002FCDFB50